jgi:hypothetical protein
MKNKKIFIIISISLVSLLFIAFLTGFLVINYYSNEEASFSCIKEEFEENICGINLQRILEFNTTKTRNMKQEFRYKMS